MAEKFVVLQREDSHTSAMLKVAPNICYSEFLQQIKERFQDLQIKSLYFSYQQLTIAISHDDDLQFFFQNAPSLTKIMISSSEQAKEAILEHNPRILVEITAESDLPPVSDLLKKTPDSTFEASLIALGNIDPSYSSLSNRILDRVKDIKYYDLTEDEKAAIHLYTMEKHKGTENTSLYFRLNKALRQQNREVLEPYLKYLKILIRALLKIPPPSSVLKLCRGFNSQISDPIKLMCTKKQKLIWHAFSSCTINSNVLGENPLFLAKSGKRTVCFIDSVWARDVQKLSAIETEEEYLLLPGSRFDIVHFVFDGDLTVLNLTEAEPEEDFYTVFTELNKPKKLIEKPLPVESLPSHPPFGNHGHHHGGHHGRGHHGHHHGHHHEHHGGHRGGHRGHHGGHHHGRGHPKC